MNHAEHAATLFLQGYNCAQSVVVAFSDVTGLDEKLSARLSSSFGGGMGRLREVCGAVSGMLLVAGVVYGYDDADTGAKKAAHYALVQTLCAKFQEQTGSIVCRQILKNPPSDPNPTPRTEEFYRTRPCARLVYLAAQILDDYIALHPPL